MLGIYTITNCFSLVLENIEFGIEDVVHLAFTIDGEVKERTQAVIEYDELGNFVTIHGQRYDLNEFIRVTN